MSGSFYEQTLRGLLNADIAELIRLGLGLGYLEKVFTELFK